MWKPAPGPFVLLFPQSNSLILVLISLCTLLFRVYITGECSICQCAGTSDHHICQQCGHCDQVWPEPPVHILNSVNSVVTVVMSTFTWVTGHWSYSGRWFQGEERQDRMASFVMCDHAWLWWLYPPVTSVTRVEYSVRHKNLDMTIDNSIISVQLL